MRSLVLPLALLAALASSAAALTPDNLDPALSAKEQKKYDSLVGNPQEAQSFLITRDYVRKADKVNKGVIPARSFPPQRPTGFTPRYLLPEDALTINDALSKYLLSSDPSSWAVA